MPATPGRAPANGVRKSAAVLWASVPGTGPANPLDTAGFMTGESYTINSADISNGSNGCFSTSPLTPLDARNCLCGGGETGSVTINGAVNNWDSRRNGPSDDRGGNETDLQGRRQRHEVRQDCL